MDLEDLAALIVVVDLGSVAAAAGALGLPRSTLRRRLAELEACVGVPLLVPGPLGVRLSEAGVVFLDRARPLLARHRALLAEIAAMKER